jgi:hypothetical protein
MVHKSKSLKTKKRQLKHRRHQKQRGGYGFYLGVDQERIGGQSSVMRYSGCPITDTLSKDYPTALYNSQGGSRRRRHTRRVRRSHRKH